MPYSRVNLSYCGGPYDNGYVFMEILVSDVSNIFAKIMEFWWESSNVPMAVESQNIFLKGWVKLLWATIYYFWSYGCKIDMFQYQFWKYYILKNGGY